MSKLIGVFTVLLLVFLAAGCAGGGGPSASTSPEGSGGRSGYDDITSFVFAYGVRARNVLDTTAGTFTNDMIGDPPVTVDLTLTPEEFARMVEEMERIGLLAYPAKYAPRGGGVMTPHMTYRFELMIDGSTRTLVWNDDRDASDPYAMRLRELVKFIREIVEAKPEYKRQPEPNGGYL